MRIMFDIRSMTVIFYCNSWWCVMTVLFSTKLFLWRLWIIVWQ